MASRKNPKQTAFRAATASAPARFGIESLETRRLLAAGTLTTVPAYLVPTAPGIETKALLTVGDSVQKTGAATGTGYRMAGIPDGLGAYDNGDGTFTVLMTHELGSSLGSVRDHGSKGAFISKWVLDKATGGVISGSDLIKQVFLYDATANGGAGGYIQATTAFQRFCSADLAPQSAFFNPASGLGTNDKIFLAGEENGNGRAFAHVVDGAQAGQSYQLARFGLYAWENAVASPFAQDKTIVAGLDDSARTFSTEGSAAPSEVYFYIGNKTNTGTAVERAGLTNGLKFGMKVTGKLNETQIVNGDRFTLANLGDVSGKTASQLQSDTTAAGVTQFRRVEDGQWDTKNPNAFYYVTTDGFGLNTRLWKATFDDIQNPELGGKIEIAFDSPLAVPGEMFDNMTVNTNGDVLLQEDVGNQAHLGKIWQYNAATGNLIQLAQHAPKFFDAAYVGADKLFITQDEESSGIIDLSHILGAGAYLADVQAHGSLTTNNPRGLTNTSELVEDGQLLLIRQTATTYQLDQDGVLNVAGTAGNDTIHVSNAGNGKTNLFLNGKYQGAFAASKVVVTGADGNDTLDAAENLTISVEFHGQGGMDLLRGAQGNDSLFGESGNDAIEGRGGADLIAGGDGADNLFGGAGYDLITGGKGADSLNGGTGEDLLVSGFTTYDADKAALAQLLAEWTSPRSYEVRIANLRDGSGSVDRVNGSVFLKASGTGQTAFDDAAADYLYVYGDNARDFMLAGANDGLFGRLPNETVDVLS